MIYICQVCNGFDALRRSCDRCGQPLDDRGRLNDMYGPYAPYRPIDDLKLTNGYDDLQQHQCMHVLHCEACNRSTVCAVQESDYAPLLPE